VCSATIPSIGLGQGERHVEPDHGLALVHLHSSHRPLPLGDWGVPILQGHSLSLPLPHCFHWRVVCGLCFPPTLGGLEGVVLDLAAVLHGGVGPGRCRSGCGRQRGWRMRWWHPPSGSSGRQWRACLRVGARYDLGGPRQDLLDLWVVCGCGLHPLPPFLRRCLRSSSTWVEAMLVFLGAFGSWRRSGQHPGRLFEIGSLGRVSLG
jgi:hypothetical protein